MDKTAPPPPAPPRPSASREGRDPRRRRRVLRALAAALGSMALIGGTVSAVLVLHLDGTLRDFLDRQSMGGMIMVVLAVNAVGFGFVYLATYAWKQVKRELWPSDDP